MTTQLTDAKKHKRKTMVKQELDNQSLGLNLGARLKLVRVQAGLSQRELARRAGVTNAAISLIESNQNSPSVASLKKVLDGIPMAMSDFFALETPEQDKVFFKADELLPLAQGQVNFLQVGDTRKHNLQILYERYEPGADTGKSMLQHESEEGGIIVEGEIELTVGDRKKVLTKGDAYLFDSRIPHRFRNTGAKECIIISGCTPPYL